MRIEQKLLHKTLCIYLVFSITVLLVSAPVFYFVINELSLCDIDKSLLILKKEFEHYSLPNIKEQDIPVINKLNKNIKIYENKENIRKSHIVNEILYDSLTKSKIKKRTLQAPVEIEGKPYLYKLQISVLAI